ncbi:hypothetical protein L3476_26140 [Paenibacillus thiaminolyticus]|uniref:hypothetical protein n=1 Tax=Paenibacillus thiaminolyticus TaxID=49283 RepID=UPI001163D984|nr:hypothetical protein [Paenibacillus thiaminolyticus]NGP58288.1 hypothetical protein [Paenibacillus thiaminolyticus]WCR26658.1 hypothetical protein L3476_26140 [Paenibacillus thiaminolyticus]
MKLKLKADTFWLRTDRGILFKNPEAIIHLEGKSLYTLFERLERYLNGRYDWNLVLNSLSEDKRNLVRSMVDSLCDNGFIREIEESQDIEPEETDDLIKYKDQIRLIANDLNEPLRRFYQFRNKKTLFVGKGPLLTAAMTAAAAAGLRAFESRAQSKDLSPLGYDIVVYVGPYTGSAIDQLASFCRLNQIDFLTAFDDSDRVIIGPYMSSDQEKSGCWFCMLDRLGMSIRSEYSDHDSEPYLYLAASSLIYEMFKHCTELHIVHSKRRHLFYVIERNTMEAESFPVIPLQHCRICSDKRIEDSRQYVTRLQKERSEIPDEESFLRRAVNALFHEKFGIIRDLDEDALEQIPYFACFAKLKLANHQTLSVASVGSSPIEARVNALKQAMQEYARSLIPEHIGYYVKSNERDEVLGWRSRDQELDWVKHAQLENSAVIVTGKSMDELKMKSLIVQGLQLDTVKPSVNWLPYDPYARNQSYESAGISYLRMLSAQPEFFKHIYAPVSIIKCNTVLFGEWISVDITDEAALEPLIRQLVMAVRTYEKFLITDVKFPSVLIGELPAEEALLQQLEGWFPSLKRELAIVPLAISEFDEWSPECLAVSCAAEFEKGGEKDGSYRGSGGQDRIASG